MDAAGAAEQDKTTTSCAAGDTDKNFHSVSEPPCVAGAPQLGLGTAQPRGDGRNIALCIASLALATEAHELAVSGCEEVSKSSMGKISRFSGEEATDGWYGQLDS